MKKFNVTGVCVPSKDYMVDISGKLKKIMKLIDEGSYFTINRARQYGKTTTLSQLQKTLPKKYICARISFQGVGDKGFESEEAFCKMFIGLVYDSLQFASVDEEYRENWADYNVTDFTMLKRHITKMCKGKKVVLMIDEVDKTSHNRVFLHFIGMLREKFLLYREDMDYTFHSVILAGVYDIKNIKLKMINEGIYIPAETENKIYNSPWNIAVSFNIDMSFSSAETATMLNDYEKDHKTGMNITSISQEIHKYTSGYPFLVSRICKCIDEELNKDWTINGVMESVKIILSEKNTLFDDIYKNLENNKKLYDLIYDVLITGEQRIFTFGNPTIDIGYMYGIIERDKQLNRITVSNKIFEIILADYFISKDEASKYKKSANILPNDIVSGSRFDMELCLRKFADHYAEIFNEDDIEFLERHGRLIFLSYLRPLLNGQGFYHLESQFTDLRRMDIVVDYGSDQFIIELKLWKGEEAERKAYNQLLGYMESKKSETGYLLIFDFRKDTNRKRTCEWIKIDGKKIFEVIV